MATILSAIGFSIVIIPSIISFGKEVPTLVHEYKNLSHGNERVYEQLALYTGGDETHAEEIATKIEAAPQNIVKDDIKESYTLNKMCVNDGPKAQL